MAEKLTIQLGFDDADVRRGLQALKRKVPEDMKDMARKASVAIGSISLGLAVTTAKAAAEAETSFAKLATIAGKETGKLKAEILALDPALGSVQGAAEAAYQAISSGTKPQETIGLVKQAALAARGGFTDMRTAIDAVTTVLNSMGGESDKIFDQFLKTQNLGKTTFGEIAGSIGDVAANAKEFGQDLPTVLGQVATLTASGINTEKAITGIRQAVVNLTKPSKEAAEELARIGLDPENLKEVGIVGIMERIAERSEDTGKAVSKIFGSVEAQTAVNTMIGQLETTKGNIDAIRDAHGDAAEAAKIMGNTTKVQVEAIGNAFEQVQIALGEEFLPMIAGAAKQIADNIGIIKAAMEILLIPVRALAAVGGAVGTVAGTAVAAGQGLVNSATGNGPGIGTVLGNMVASGEQMQADQQQQGFLQTAASFLPIVGPLAGQLGGGRAGGGPVSPGKVYTVGENGPETFVPSQSGNILPGSGGVGGGANDLQEAIAEIFGTGAAEGAMDGLMKGTKKAGGKAAGGKKTGVTGMLFGFSETGLMQGVVSGLGSGDVKGSMKDFAEQFGEGAKRSLVMNLKRTLSSKLISFLGLGGLSFPGFARGTAFAPGGLSLVGEEGPELVNLPRGSRVNTAQDTRRMMGGVTLNIGTLVMGSPSSGESPEQFGLRAAQAMAEAMLEANRQHMIPEFATEFGAA